MGLRMGVNWNNVKAIAKQILIAKMDYNVQVKQSWVMYLEKTYHPIMVNVYTLTQWKANKLVFYVNLRQVITSMLELLVLIVLIILEILIQIAGTKVKHHYHLPVIVILYTDPLEPGCLVLVLPLHLYLQRNHPIVQLHHNHQNLSKFVFVNWEKINVIHTIRTMVWVYYQIVGHYQKLSIIYMVPTNIFQCLHLNQQRLQVQH